MIADAIKTYYPRDNVLPTDKAMGLWYDMLKDLDYQTAYVALKKHVVKSKFAPTIADILENAEDITQPQQLNEMEAWSLVSRAIRNSGYNSVEEFAKLPPVVQKCVGQPEQLRTWALDEDYNETVVSAAFIKTYRVEETRAREIEKMPKDIRRLIERVNQNSLSAQIQAKTQEVVKLSLEDEQKEIEGNMRVAEEPKDFRSRIETLLGGADI